jgi:hypothetical protein
MNNNFYFIFWLRGRGKSENATNKRTTTNKINNKENGIGPGYGSRC